MIEIRAVGGYSEIGRNMTAVKVGDEVVIFDMGLDVGRYSQITEDEDFVKISTAQLVAGGALPDLKQIKDWLPMVKAIVPTHAHLDHVGGIPYLAQKIKAPIICSPFTAEVVKELFRDKRTTHHNKVIPINPNSKHKFSDNLTLELIHITHSTLQATIAALHTPDGVIIYANDFKFDNYPMLGKKPNLARLAQLGDSGKVICLITESTYAGVEGKTPSESVAQQMLKDIMVGSDLKGAMLVTTFSSHIARLKAIADFSHKIKRKPIFLGRSFSKYIKAAEKLDLVNISKNAEVISYRRQINSRLTKLKNNLEKYVLVVTGNQGEPRATLSRMARGETPIELSSEDTVIFSCRTIPSPNNIKLRGELEKMLSAKDVRMYMDVHVSGHASREDLRDLINLTKPLHLVPSHGTHDMKTAFKDLAQKKGYEDSKIHILENGKLLMLNI